MESAGAFEWELSKENVAQLHGGRSVALLNKVLSAQNSGEFLNKRQQLRQHFELKLCGLKNSFAKLRLYVRYLHWVEQTYPSLSHSPDLENLLFRCVRDAAQLPQVQNDEDFVNMWIRLTEYCERPAELFEMLFRQGVGTMCVKFYIAWADLLKSQHLLAPAAAVYAHGLRTGAQPLTLLEDHAELFAARLKATLDEIDSKPISDSVLFDVSTISDNVHSRPVRQTLAALSLVEPEPGSSKRVPVMRTNECWHADQSGLHKPVTMGNMTRDSQGQPKVIRNPNRIPESDPVQLLHTFAPITRPVVDENAPLTDCTAVLRPLGQPSSWQKENMAQPRPWLNEKVSLVISLPRIVSRPFSF
ncbi:hypothetical protein P879_08311 [Paragonimus westermani]|uniref:BUB1 N-terminal domain-containing protein n=1 Tax=Paragonimus westermani TaxID=34504 RepID=A0A8T0D310_9TREM|nr:hypothetical protein P879_08311 [Paragonimus westermani]